MSDYLSLLMNVFVIGLLAVTIWWAARLNRALGRMRDSRADMEAAILRFSEASIRAEKAIQALKTASSEHGEGLTRETERAKAILTELKDLNEIAAGTAMRLERSVETLGSVKAQAAAAAPAPRPTARVEEPPVVRSRAEKELIAALMRDTAGQ